MSLISTSRTAFCLCFLCLALPAPVVLAENARSLEQLADDIDIAEQQLEVLKQQLEQNQSLKNDLQSVFAASQEKRGERDQRLAELDQRIGVFSARLDEMDATVKAAGDNITKYQSTLSQALINAQIVGTDTRLKALLQHSDPVAALRLSTFTDYLFRAQSEQLQIAIAFLQQIEDARLSTLKDKNWLEHIRAKATGQRDAFAKAEDSTRVKIESVNNELEQTTRSVAELEQDQQRLQLLMEELERLQRSGSGYFAAFKGQFTMPVEGTIAARFGTKKSLGTLLWDGMYINAVAGNPVQAIADGEVVYSAWLQGFGMLVVIDHGDGYMTLYGGNSEVTATVGAWVSSGTTIASVGDSGGQNASGLYFEIRHNARALDPAEWLSDVSSGA